MSSINANNRPQKDFEGSSLQGGEAPHIQGARVEGDKDAEASTSSSQDVQDGGASFDHGDDSSSALQQTSGSGLGASPDTGLYNAGEPTGQASDSFPRFYQLGQNYGQQLLQSGAPWSEQGVESQIYSYLHGQGLSDTQIAQQLPTVLEAARSSYQAGIHGASGQATRGPGGVDSAGGPGGAGGAGGATGSSDTSGALDNGHGDSSNTTTSGTPSTQPFQYDANPRTLTPSDMTSAGADYGEQMLVMYGDVQSANFGQMLATMGQNLQAKGYSPQQIKAYEDAATTTWNTGKDIMNRPPPEGGADVRSRQSFLDQTMQEAFGGQVRPRFLPIYSEDANPGPASSEDGARAGQQLAQSAPDTNYDRWEIQKRRDLEQTNMTPHEITEYLRAARAGFEQGAGQAALSQPINDISSDWLRGGPSAAQTQLTADQYKELVGYMQNLKGQDPNKYQQFLTAFSQAHPGYAQAAQSCVDGTAQGDTPDAQLVNSYPPAAGAFPPSSDPTTDKQNAAARVAMTLDPTQSATPTNDQYGDAVVALANLAMSNPTLYQQTLAGMKDQNLRKAIEGSVNDMMAKTGHQIGNPNPPLSATDRVNISAWYRDRMSAVRNDQGAWLDPGKSNTSIPNVPDGWMDNPSADLTGQQYNDLVNYMNNLRASDPDEYARQLGILTRNSPEYGNAVRSAVEGTGGDILSRAEASYPPVAAAKLEPDLSAKGGDAHRAALLGQTMSGVPMVNREDFGDACAALAKAKQTIDPQAYQRLVAQIQPASQRDAMTKEVDAFLGSSSFHADRSNWTDDAAKYCRQGFGA